ncbi:unnamed protein product [Clonostachys chloroleuca]|uniref:non-reducing end alpha-L-arabinofuranosidase n=1 Tax=Clonostachys chloroleuca TaxID=1926264 RepID=A0AA35Q508_9HYPO|nr:unnamed protein product [Clonostachys chloroleuca]
MTTFTKITDEQQPVISVNPAFKLSDIDDKTYSGFTEHMSRCIYGGIYDIDSPLSDEDGFRKDVIEALKELNSPVVRYPGGNFCATYHWQDGIGPRENRPKRPELAWIGLESNQFGTDEFMKWCEKVGTAPYIALNMNTGTLDEALAWVEYCNSTQDTYYANLRRKNGHEEPYNVKYWALGNEMWGPWQVEQMTKEDYAKKAFQWAKALKLLDPSIELILCGKEGQDAWDYHVLKECIKFDRHARGNDGCLIEMHSIHLYTCSNDHLENVTAPRAAERCIEMTGALIDLVHAENKIPSHVRKQKICFDEWNVWDSSRANGRDGAEEKYTLSDALAVATWLNAFIRQSKYIGMANIAQSVNVISPLMTTKYGIYKQTTWWPWLLFCKYMRGTTIAVNVQSAEYEGSTNPDWLRGAMETPWLDVSASIKDGVVSLVVVNIHESKSFSTKLDGIPSGANVEVYTVAGDNIGVINTAEKSEVEVEESKWQAKESYEFPKASMTMLRWKA